MQRMLGLSQQLSEHADKISFLSNTKRETAAIAQKLDVGSPLGYGLVLIDPQKFEASKKEVDRFISRWNSYNLDYDEILRYPLSIQGSPRTRTQLFEALLHFAIAVLCVHESAADVVVVKGGTRPLDAAFVYVSRFLGIPSLICERGPFPDSLTLSRGIGPKAFLSNCSIGLRSSIEESRFIEQYRMSDASAWEQPDRKEEKFLRAKYGLKDSQKVCFFAGQVNDDANMQLFSPLFRSTQDVFKRLVEDFRESDDVVIIAKPHPKENSVYSGDLLDSLGVKVFIDRDINIKDAISLADCVITNNSTIGFESLLYMTPVVTSAESFYDSCEEVFKFDPEQGFRSAFDRAIKIESDYSSAILLAKSILKNFSFFYQESGRAGADGFFGAILKEGQSRSGKACELDKLVCEARDVVAFYSESLVLERSFRQNLLLGGRRILRSLRDAFR